MTDVAIIGAGTAGMSAAIYAARSGRSVIIFEALSYGGQIVASPEVENYPGLPKISGMEFADALHSQLCNNGIEVTFGRVSGIISDGEKRTVICNGKEYACRTVIIATGAKNRPLGLEHEQELIGRGVSYCATCDGAFFRGLDVAVVGGGNTALEDAMFLSNRCRSVTLIHRRDTFRGEKRLVENLRRRDNVAFVMNSVVTALRYGDRLSGITVKNTSDATERELAVSGLFVAVGQMPDNAAFAPLVALDDHGYIIAGEDCKTSADGVFAAGDARTKKVRQLATAAADGAVAALAASEYIG